MKLGRKLELPIHLIWYTVMFHDQFLQHQLTVLGIYLLLLMIVQGYARYISRNRNQRYSKILKFLNIWLRIVSGKISTPLDHIMEVNTLKYIFSIIVNHRGFEWNTQFHTNHNIMVWLRGKIDHWRRWKPVLSKPRIFLLLFGLKA